MARNIKPVFQISPEAYLGAAAILLLVPLPWVTAWLIAAAVHEMSHCLMLKACKMPIERICIGLQGAQIQTCVLTDSKAILCSLAGPVGGLFLLLLVRHFPRLVLCALVQSAFNLLPVYPFDGGRAMRSALCLFLPPGLANKISNIVEVIVLSSIVLIGVAAGFILKLGVFPFILSVYILLRVKKIKIPCK